MSSSSPESDSSAHAAKKPKKQSVLAPVFNTVLASPNKDLVSSASLKEEHPQIQPVDDATEENLLIFQQASENIVEDREPSPSQVAASPAAVLSLTSSAKNVVASRMVQAVDVTQAASQSGLDMTKSMSANNTETFLNDTFDQMIMKSTDYVLKQYEDDGDDHLLMTNDELAEIAASPGELEMPSLHQPRKRQCFSGHLGSLPPRVRQQAVYLSLVKLRQIKQSALEIYLQLSQITSIISNVKQEGTPLSVSQEKLHQIWAHWIRIVPGNREPHAVQIEYRMIILFRKVFQQLLDIIVQLLSNIHGLHDDIETKIKQTLHVAEDLEPTLVGACSFEDLSCSFMTLVHKESEKILEFLDQILDYLSKNRPLTWIVGPFVLSRQDSQKAKEASEMIEED